MKHSKLNGSHETRFGMEIRCVISYFTAQVNI